MGTLNILTVLVFECRNINVLNLVASIGYLNVVYISVRIIHKKNSTQKTFLMRNDLSICFITPFSYSIRPLMSN